MTPWLGAVVLVGALLAPAAEHLYFPPPGNTETAWERHRPREAGLSDSVVQSVNEWLTANPYTRNGRKYEFRWALWRHGYLLHAEGDFLRKADVASLRKTWYAMAVGAALRHGKIASLDEPLSRYEKDLKGNDALATWKHVMTQSAGFDYPAGPYPDFKPGEMWTYSDRNPHHLCNALAKAYGHVSFFDHFDDVMKEAYFDAIGMRRWYSRNIIDHGESGLWDGPRLVIDMEHMGRLGLLALARGSWNGKELVPRSFVEALETKQTRGMLSSRLERGGSPPAARNAEAEKKETPYGYLTWVNTDGDLHPGADRRWARASGAGGSTVLWNHTNGIVFVGFGINDDKIPNLLERAIEGDNPLAQRPSVPQVGHWDTYEDWTERDGGDEVRLIATVVAPGGAKHTLLGGRERGSHWRVRFTPHELGVYKYESRFSDGRIGPSGAFRAVASEYTAARPAGDGFTGRWAIQADDGRVFWLELKPDMSGSFFGATGGRLAALQDARVVNGELQFTASRVFDGGRTVRVFTVARRAGSDLRGSTRIDDKTWTWRGWRSPDIADRDDGSWVEGTPLPLIDGFRQLRPAVSGGEKQWSIEGGVLRNLSPKAPLLVTAKEFWNFALHVEYKLPKGGNSGIGLRNHYELQLADDYGQPPDVHGNVSLYSRIKPRVNASRPAGEWQSLDLRLVGRELTVTLNGTKVIDRQTIEGLCGLALDPREERPGPIALQGDHGGVEFRNVVVTPLTRR
jgi:hypothetical protein